MSDYDRDTIVADAREEAEATGSGRWSDALVQRQFDWVYAREWRKILAANPTYRWALRTPIASASAQIPFTLLDSPQPLTGNSQERFSKVLAVARDNVLYQESRFLDNPLLTLEGSGPVHRWWPEGDHIALPMADANATMRVWVSHTPTPPSQLSAGTQIVVFPRGYSGVLVHELAAALLAKGSSETDLAVEQKSFANEIRLEMLDEITRRSTAPMFFDPVDTSAEWGAR